MAVDDDDYDDEPDDGQDEIDDEPDVVGPDEVEELHAVVPPPLHRLPLSQRPPT